MGGMTRGGMGDKGGMRAWGWLEPAWPFYGAKGGRDEKERRKYGRQNWTVNQKNPSEPTEPSLNQKNPSEPDLHASAKWK